MNSHIRYRSDPQVGHFGKIRTVNSILVVLEEEYRWKMMVIFSFWACEVWVPRNYTFSGLFMKVWILEQPKGKSKFLILLIWLQLYRAEDFGFVFEQAISDPSEDRWRYFNFQQKLNQRLREIRLSYCSFGGGWGKGIGEKVWRKVVCVQKQRNSSYK